MLTIGLTGGIGSGKSAVADLFKKLGISIIDADKIAHAITEPGKSGYHAITEHFGADILQPNGQLDRHKLRDLIFSNDAERQWLEAELHPIIRRDMRSQALDATSPYCMMVIPLLTESNNFDHIDRVLVVDLPEELQIARACERDHCDAAQIQKIMAAQNSRDERLTYADDVIENDGDLNALENEVTQLHQLYSGLSNN